MSTLLATSTPVEVLLEESLKPLSSSQCRLARDLDVPPRRINEFVHGTRAVTADTALRLSRYFGTTPQFWMNLETLHDLEEAERRSGDAIRARVPVRAEGEA